MKKLLIPLAITASSAGALATENSKFFITTPLIAEAYAVSDIAVSTENLNFGTLQLGDSSTKKITLTNTKNTAVNLQGIRVSNYEFSHDCGTTLEAGASCDVSITYTATENSNVVGYLYVSEVQKSSIWASSRYAKIKATGSLDFGTMIDGEEKRLKTTIQNIGNAVMQPLISGLPQGVELVNSCPQVSPGASCELELKLTAHPGLSDTVITVSSQFHQAQIPLKITRITPSNLVLTSSIGFGDVVIGSTASKTISVENTGQAEAKLKWGKPLDDLTLNHNCPEILQGGASCSATLSWVPGVAQPMSSTIDVSSDTQVRTIAITGNALTPPNLSVNTAADFGVVNVGLSTVARTWTISNSGQAPATMTYAALPKDFVRTGTCSSVLAGNSSCTVTLTWTPKTLQNFDRSYAVTGLNLRLKGQAKEIDFSHLMTGYTKVAPYTTSRADGWIATTWVWRSNNGHSGVANGQVFDTRQMYHNTTGAPIQAHLQGGVDAAKRVFRVNGVDIPITWNWKTSTKMATFTLQPGKNVIELVVNASGNSTTPAGVAAWIVNTKTGAKLSSNHGKWMMK